MRHNPFTTSGMACKSLLVFWSTSSSLFVLCRDSWQPHWQVNSYKSRKTWYTLYAVEGVYSPHRLRPFVRLLGTFQNPNPGMIFLKRESRSTRVLSWREVNVFSPLQARSAAPRYCLQNGPLPRRMWVFRCSSHTCRFMKHLSSDIFFCPVQLNGNKWGTFINQEDWRYQTQVNQFNLEGLLLEEEKYKTSILF